VSVPRVGTAPGLSALKASKGRSGQRAAITGHNRRMAILVDDSTETVLSIYGEASDLVGFKSLRPRSQGRCGCE
jgi:hypothetical protein